MLTGFGSYVAAQNEGRTWDCYFNKTAVGSGSATGGVWNDWSQTVGTPQFDARIDGTPLAFYPCISGAAGKHLHIGPNPPSGRSRYLIAMDFSTSGNQGNNTVTLYDLLGYYPFIDGDGGVQALDNTLTLPRYTDGEGVMMILHNTVAPSSSGSNNCSIDYIDQSGNAKTTPLWGKTGINNATAMQWSNAASAQGRVPFIPLASGSRGVRSVTSINIPTLSGGYYWLALVKPLYSFGCNIVAGLQNDRCMCLMNGFQFPIIEDGACLNLIETHLGSQSGASRHFGRFHFAFM